MIQTDEYGFEYYEWPSSTWIKPKHILHFVDINPNYEGYYKVKIGLKYILYSELKNRYEVYKITEHTRDKDIIDFIKQERLYLLSLA